MPTENITFHPSVKFHQKFEAFYQHYEIIDILSCPAEPIVIETPKNERICRFCARRYPHVAFNMKAHVIPELLGNKYWIADDECDACNMLFATREAQLANFFGIQRTLNSTVGKDGIPNFPSNKGGIEAKKEMFLGLTEAIALSRGSTESEGFEKLGNTILFKVHKPTYQPILVYKALFKMGLALFPKNEMSNFNYALKYLQARKKAQFDIKTCPFSYYQSGISTTPNSPGFFVFRKREHKLRCPTFHYAMRYKNFFINFPMLLHKSDLHFYNTDELMPILSCPPLFTDLESAKTTEWAYSQRDFSTYEKVSDDYDSFTIEGDFNNASAFDPESRQIVTDAEQSPIKKLYFVSDLGFSIPLTNTKKD